MQWTHTCMVLLDHNVATLINKMNQQRLDDSWTVTAKAKLSVTSHWKKLKYSKATLERNVWLTKAKSEVKTKYITFTGKCKKYFVYKKLVSRWRYCTGRDYSVTRVTSKIACNNLSEHLLISCNNEYIWLIDNIYSDSKHKKTVAKYFSQVTWQTSFLEYSRNINLS